MLALGTYMGTIVDLSLPQGALPLGLGLPETGRFELELERVVPVAATACPFFWLVDRSDAPVPPGQISAFERALADEVAIDSLDRVGITDGGVCYRVTWRGEPPEFLRAVAETDGAILEGRGTDAKWSFRLRFDDPDRIAAFQRYCHENDVPIEITRLCSLEDCRTVVPDELTAAQTDALMTAYRMGYFDRPRETSLEEIAEALGISPQAAGGRIRRGVSNLVADALPEKPPEDAESGDDVRT